MFGILFQESIKPLMLKFDNDIHKKRIIRRPLRGTELVMEQTVSAVYFSYLQDWIDAAAHCSLRYWVLSTYLHCFNFMTLSLPEPQMKILLFLLIQLIFLYQSLMIKTRVLGIFQNDNVYWQQHDDHVSEKTQTYYSRKYQNCLWWK